MEASATSALWREGPDGLVVLGPDGVVQSCNPRLARWLESSIDDLEGRRLEEALGTEEAEDGRLRLGDDLWVERYEVTLEAGARLVGFRDVTTVVQIEARARRQAAALEESLNGYDTVDAQGRLTYANRAYLEMWGYDSLDEVRGMSAAEHCADPDVPRKIMEEVSAHGRATKEFLARRKDGSTFQVMMSIQAAQDAHGAPTFIGTSLDVTELVRFREHREEAAKLEALGRLAAGVAHDFNNLLTPILGYTDLLLQDPRPAEEAEVLEVTRTAAMRARQLTQQLLTVSRQQVIAPEQAELGTSVAELEGLLRRALREDIDLRIHRPSSEVWTIVDPDRLQQVLLNLVYNAQDAMPTGGKLTIEVSQRTFDEAAAAMRPGLVPGAYCEIVVSDSGVGMTPEATRRVFDPFFSTKGSKGTGIGLATVKGIVEQHGGAVWLHSELDHGTTFKVYLPQVSGPSEERPREEPRVHAERAGHVLVVEDDAAVRGSVEHILRAAGHVVFSAPSGEAALGWMAAYDGPLDLLLTDVVLTGCNGRELADEARARRPDLRVLYMSGYTGNVVMHHGVLDEGIELLQKPFSSSELLAEVGRQLGGR